MRGVAKSASYLSGNRVQLPPPSSVRTDPPPSVVAIALRGPAVESPMPGCRVRNTTRKLRPPFEVSWTDPSLQAPRVALGHEPVPSKPCWESQNAIASGTTGASGAVLIKPWVGALAPTQASTQTNGRRPKTVIPARRFKSLAF